MDISKLKSIFPLEVIVTKEIIVNSDVQDVHNCIGTNTLKKALKENGFELDYSNISWGCCDGHIERKRDTIRIMSFLDKEFKKDVDMMEIIEPTKVFLKLG